jgi:zinc metalloprotease ZmpB
MKFLNFFLLINFILATNFLFAKDDKNQTHEEKKVHKIDLVEANLFFANQSIDFQDSSALKNFATNYLFQKTNLKYEIVLADKIESPLMFHFNFDIYKEGFKIYRNFIKISVLKNQKTIKTISYLCFDSEISTEQEIEYALNQADNLDVLKSEKVWFITSQGLKLCNRIEKTNYVDIHFEEIFDNGKLIYQNDLIAYHHQSLDTDSIVKGSVFNPDPLTTANQVYGAPYIHANNSDVPELNNQIQIKNFYTKFENDTFYLENNWVKITNHSPPNYAVTTSLTDSFVFTRSMYQFEEVNAFYHLSQYQNYLQSLGFSLVNYQINADAHALNGNDNSNFSAASSPPRLNFGDGGVPDAEDADVIIHEYGHAISHSAAPNTNVGQERRAIDEAIGDYLAAVYSKEINSFGSERVFSWDGHNEFWAGRIINTSKVYPTDLVSSIHRNGEIFSTALMNIYLNIGREKADKILLQSLYNYFPNMTMPQAARIYLQTDTLMYNHQNSGLAMAKFVERKILESSISSNYNISDNFKIINSVNFAKEEVLIYLPENASGNFLIFDYSGRIISEENFQNQAVISVPANTSLAQGIYFLKLNTKDYQKTFKLIK